MNRTLTRATWIHWRPYTGTSLKRGPTSNTSNDLSMNLHESYTSEQMKNQACGIGHTQRFEHTTTVQGLWQHEERDLEGCVQCKVEGVDRIFSWVPSFAHFVRRQPEHGMRITEVKYIGDPLSIYSKMVRYMTGESTAEEDESIMYRIKSKKTPLSKISNP